MEDPEKDALLKKAYMFQEQMKNKNRKLSLIIICIICILLIFFLPLPISSIIIAKNYENTACQNDDPIGMSLASWLLGMGIYGICILVSYIFVSLVSGDKPLPLKVLDFLNNIFILIYTIIGAVLLFRSNLECLKSGNPLGVLTLINLILFWLSFIALVCRNRSSSE